MKHSTGIILMGTDERRQAPQPLIQAAIIGEPTNDYAETDYVERAIERDRLRNASALYVRIGRWNLWLYWRRRTFSGCWFTLRDIQAEHALTEGASA